MSVRWQMQRSGRSRSDAESCNRKKNPLGGTAGRWGAGGSSRDIIVAASVGLHGVPDDRMSAVGSGSFAVPVFAGGTGGLNGANPSPNGRGCREAAGEGYKREKDSKNYMWYPSPGPLARAILSRWEKDHTKETFQK